MYDEHLFNRWFDRLPLPLIPVAMVLTFLLCLAAPVAIAYAIVFAANAF